MAREEIIGGVLPRGWGILPYMGYIGMCDPKGYRFSAVLVKYKVSILAILVINMVWFFTLVLNWVFFLKK